jgi:hypothetical protein
VGGGGGGSSRLTVLSETSKINFLGLLRVSMALIMMVIEAFFFLDELAAGLIS